MRRVGLAAWVTIAVVACGSTPAIQLPPPSGDEGGATSRADGSVPGADAAPDASTPVEASAGDVGTSPDTGSPDTGAPPDPFGALQALPGFCSADQWCFRFPTPTGNDYSKVHSTGPDDIWLSGRHGTVLQWNGKTWKRHILDVGGLTTYLPMGAIAGTGPNDVWIVFGDTLQHWDGTTWTAAYTATGLTQLYNVWEAPDGTVFSTSSDTDVLVRAPGATTFVPTPDGCNCTLYSVWGTSSSDVFFTTIGSIVHYDGKQFAVTPYGSTETAGSYQGVAGDTWVAGDDGTVMHWDGKSWTSVPSGLPQYWVVTSVGYVASDDVWWWAQQDSAHSAFLHWNGKTIETTTIDTTWLSVFFNDAAIIDGRWWLVGGEGKVFTRSDQGTLEAIINPVTDSSITSMWATSPDNVYFATGVEFMHWDGTKYTDDTTVRPNDIDGVHHSDGTDELWSSTFEAYTSDGDLMYDAYLLHYDGSTWTKSAPVTSNGNEHYLFTGVHALGPDEAMAVGGNGMIYYWSNGAWTALQSGTTNDLYGVWGPDADHLYVVGTNGTLLQWNRANPTVFTPDPTLPPTTNDLTRIHGAGGITWVVVNGTETVLENAGSGWQTVTLPFAPVYVYAISATDVVFSAEDSGHVGRWNGTTVSVEDTGHEATVRSFYQVPGGPMLAGSGYGALLTHP
jgi:hypothetical protein